MAHGRIVGWKVSTQVSIWTDQTEGGRYEAVGDYTTPNLSSVDACSVYHDSVGGVGFH